MGLQPQKCGIAALKSWGYNANAMRPQPHFHRVVAPFSWHRCLSSMGLQHQVYDITAPKIGILASTLWHRSARFLSAVAPQCQKEAKNPDFAHDSSSI
ncbi:hypothetical protein PanWU01x14_237700 [Parasponia andersonii]|uniref:Uncharacterized protein n=1 Tax=Parasponia andersonii TaxID=3476 RepID=A0A2P5BHW1_PARAD|nr:hypothetical protein PanWU01x14_237700 [Parasponia andersonii]